MSILKSMVSTNKRYKSDNFPVLHNANSRGECLYQVRLYADRPSFVSAQSGMLRMQVLLGFIEARATVIDAVIKTQGNLHYLSIICSSVARPPAFSLILKKTVPRAIIEEISRTHAEECIAARAVRDEVWNAIPHSSAVRNVHESRRILLALLLEYRALLAECSTALPERRETAGIAPASDFSIPFLFFEQDGSICAIPDFQVEQISPGGNGSHILHLQHGYGSRVIVCSDLVCIKEIDIVACKFLEKKTRGYYRISTKVTGGNFDFTIVVPSFL